MTTRPTEAVDFTHTFTSKSHLTYLVPRSTSFSLDCLATVHHEPATSSAESIIGSIEQRESLFFDETAPVLLVLKTPVPSGLSRDPKEYLRTIIIPRLVIDLEASVVNADTPGATAPPLEDVIFAELIDEAREPLIVYNGRGEQEESGDTQHDDDDDDEFEGWAYAAWAVPVFLQRPRMRLQDPSVVLRAAATLKPMPDNQFSASSSSSQPSSPLLGQRPATYLSPGRPSSLNLLASLAADPTVTSYTPIPPRLSALRVSRVAPITQARHAGVPLRALERIKLPVYPAVQTRMRLSRPAGTSLPPSLSGVVAVVEVDFTPHSDFEMLLDGIEMRISAAVVEDLGEGVPGLALPLRCVAHDHLTFLYRITPTTTLDPEAESGLDPAAALLRDQQLVRQLDITVKVTAQILPGKCTPQLVMDWSAPIDFSAPVNPGYGPAKQPIQRLRRPSQLSINAGARDGKDVATSLISPSVTRPDSLPVLDEAVAAAAARTAEMAIPDLGITVTFTAPPDPVAVGEDFTWMVHVVNRTSEKNPNVSPRKLALVALPWRKRADVAPSRGGPPASTRPVSRIKKHSGHVMAAADTSDAVIDQASVYALQRNAQLELTDVVCLSADARIGPLLPGACHVTEMSFIALREGILGVEAIRVIDLGSQEHVDVRELPVMVVRGVEAH